MSSDDAILFSINQADPSITPDYDELQTEPEEDPYGGKRPDHHAHAGHSRLFDNPRVHEQPRGQVPPLPTPHDSEGSHRVPLSQLTPRTRERDRDLYSNAALAR